MRIENNIDLIEQILQTNSWLGGQLPCKADREQFLELSKAPEPTDHPNAFMWYLLIGKFT